MKALCIRTIPLPARKPEEIPAVRTAPTIHSTFNLLSMGFTPITYRKRHELQEIGYGMQNNSQSKTFLQS